MALELPFVPGLAVAVHQGNRRGLDSTAQQLACVLGAGREIELEHKLSSGAEPLGDFDHGGVQRLGLVDLEREDVRTRL